MLITFDQIKRKHPNIYGILHIGAHKCEELSVYNKCGVSNKNIVWIEANPSLIKEIKTRFKSSRVIQACVSDIDGQEITFKITNNGQSSSMLNLKDHLKEHPHVKVTNTINLTTKTMQTIYTENNLDPKFANFLNIDIQGAELLALKGMQNLIENFDYIYLEVNERELYENCALIGEIDDYLKKYGFVRKETKMTKFGWGDALYVKE